MDKEMGTFMLHARSDEILKTFKPLCKDVILKVSGIVVNNVTKLKSNQKITISVWRNQGEVEFLHD